MPFLNDLSVRKHAQNFLRQLDVKHLQDYKISSQKFSTLCAVRKDARLAATSILDKVKDGMAEERASELEAAHDGVSQFLAAIEAELDFRTEPPPTKVEGFSGLERLRRTVGSFPTEVGGFKPDFWKMKHFSQNQQR